MNVKKQAYSKASTKYMNYMATTFTQDVIREIRAKMKSSPKCPTGVVGGGPTLRGMARAVTGGVRAACGGPGKPKCETKTRPNGRPSRITAGQVPARIANGIRNGAPQARSRS